MNKTILIGVACFLAAIAASTGVVILRTAPKAAATDSTAVADSTVHAGAANAGAPPEETPTSEYDLDTPAEEFGGPSAIELAAAVPHAAEPARDAGAARPAAEPADYGRVGKILVNMKPVEAAAILGHLSDPQVEGVLRSMGPRPAAILLAALPVERAAALSRRLLVPAPQEKKP